MHVIHENINSVCYCISYVSLMPEIAITIMINHACDKYVHHKVGDNQQISQPYFIQFDVLNDV